MGKGRERLGGAVKNSTGNREAKELTFMTHGHELRGWNVRGNGNTKQRGRKGRKNGTTVIAKSKKYTKK